MLHGHEVSGLGGTKPESARAAEVDEFAILAT
jgi:hypothetical protein